MAVVMCDELAHHMFEMFAIEDQETIQTFRANGSHEPLRYAVGVRAVTTSTARSMPRLISIGFAPATTFFAPSR